MRTVFGSDPEGYDRARQPYPARVYRILRERCHLAAGATVVEIGPGTGIASRGLLRAAPRRLVLVEADPRMARYLRRRLTGSPVTVVASTFEAARLPSGVFDLVAAATSFHWLPRRRSLRKVARLLKPGGWWADWATQHSDPDRPSRFQEALRPLYRAMDGPPRDRLPPAVWQAALRRTRLRELRSLGPFDRVACEEIHWSVTLTRREVVALWRSFSDITVRPDAERRWILRELGRTVDRSFGGQVRFPVLTTVYTARRRAGGRGLRAGRPRRRGSSRRISLPASKPSRA